MNKLVIILLCLLPSLLIVSCEKDEYNAYIVSSELISVPIIESDTGQTIGQAYNGFAVSIDEVRNQRAYFYINISDPSLPNVSERMELYISIDNMKKANVEPQIPPPIISLDMIIIKPLVDISWYRESGPQVIAKSSDEIGPMPYIQRVENSYLFTLGMHLVYVSEQDAKLIKYDD